MEQLDGREKPDVASLLQALERTLEFEEELASRFEEQEEASKSTDKPKQVILPLGSFLQCKMVVWVGKPVTVEEERTVKRARSTCEFLIPQVVCMDDKSHGGR